MRKPIIGIVPAIEYVDKGRCKKKVYSVNEDYINLIKENDGIPIVLPYISKFNDIEKYLESIDALLLIGGEDISKKCFSGKKSENERDNFEISLYKYFKKNKKPIFGICRGLQLVNVAEGGIVKDIENSLIDHFLGVDGWINYHEIILEENTKLYDLINEKKYTVSSVHHQQIDKLGNNLKISAYSKDGIIEAIESTDDTFVMAVQGHIEKCNNNFDKYNLVIKRFIREAQNEKK